ncbi:MAG: serine/threonine-protein kinase, partial [Myxococcota bacterium]
MLSTDPEAQTMLAPAAADSVEGDAETLAMQGTGAPEPTKKRGKRRKKSFTPLARGSALGRYVVLDQLGAGGMGVVYAAYDPELDRRIAIKLLQTEEGAPDDATAGHARLLREAQAMAKLTHPNVIAVYDVGSFEDSVFVAMEFVDGTTITAHLDELWEDGPPPWRDVVALYAGAGRGLAAAHAAGVVHRDFKPDNVMVGEDGRVLVLDFGLARPTGEIA